MSGRLPAAFRATAALALLLCGSCSGAESFEKYGSRQGKLVFDASFNLCPRIERMTVAPLQLAVGGYGLLRARGTDTDSDPATLAFRWRGTRGIHVVSARTASSSYVCTQAGAQQLTLTVTDQGGCDDAVTVDVTCVP